MRAIVIAPILFLVACAGAKEDRKSSNLLTEEVIEVDTLSFQYFQNQFTEMTLPIHFDSSYLWDGTPFWMEQEEAYDFNANKIPIHLLDKWIIDQDHSNSSFSAFVEENREWLNEDDGWNNVYYGGSFKEENRNYFIVYVYDKPSQINGAQFYYYFMEFNNEELIEIIELGMEGVETYSYVEETEEESLWWRNTTYTAQEITISAGSEIEVCEFKRLEVEGDLTTEQMENVNQPNVYLDSNGTYLEIYPVKCTTY